MKRVLYLIILIAFAVSCGGLKNNSIIQGYVRMGTKNISSAKVTVGEKTVLSNDEGYFEMTDVAEGTYTITVDASGYDIYTKQIEVSGGKTIRHDVALVQNVNKKYIVNGFERLKLGEHIDAIASFDRVLLADSGATELEKASAYSGRGYAKTHLYGLLTALNDFQLSKDFNTDALIGYAAALVRRGDIGDVNNAIILLEEKEFYKLDFEYVPVFAESGLNTAKVHAIIAMAYFIRNSSGDLQRAYDHINKASELDSNIEGSDIDQVENLFNKINL